MLNIKLIVLASAFLYTYVASISICRNIDVSGLDIPDGEYLSINDYRGRPDFYSIGGGEFNLFGEESDDNSCIWRIDSTESLFPYYETSDCSFHPNDIDPNSQWFLYTETASPIEVSPEFRCILDEGGSSNLLVILVSIFSSVFIIALIVYMHVILRRRRIAKWKERCPICVKRVNGASSVIRKSFVISD